MHQTHTLATQPEGYPSTSPRFDRAGSVESVRSGRLVLLADDDLMVRLVVRLCVPHEAASSRRLGEAVERLLGR